MKERPILFSAPMVRAIIDGKKTQTRRVVKPQPLWVADPSVPFRSPDAAPEGIINCPYGQPVNRLWVRETWQHAGGNTGYWYRATDSEADEGGSPVSRWRPSIHMPRWASRITLEITAVRVERLQDISEQDAIAEGVETWRSGWDKRTAATMFLNGTRARVETHEGGIGKRLFYLLWESINGPQSWASNPWVWVIEFKVQPS